MNIQVVKITDIKPNPNNPRTIDKIKFGLLVKSIQEFPDMLNLRPLVVNKDMMVIGGSMRLKACIKLGIKEVPIIIAENLTESEQREFLIKDNSNFGSWNYEELANDWDIELLSDWGLEIPIEVFGDEEKEIELESITKTISFKYTIDEAARIENELYLIDSTLEGALKRLLEINKK
jgi:ParB-like chromosome segregation protein Spo0J